MFTDGFVTSSTKPNLFTLLQRPSLESTMAQSPLKFHGRVHSPSANLQNNDSLAILPISLGNKHFLYSNRPMQVNETLALNLSALSETSVTVSIAFTQFGPEHNEASRSFLDYDGLGHAEGVRKLSGYCHTMGVKGPVSQDLSFSVNAEGVVSRYENGLYIEDGRRVELKSNRFWVLLYVESTLKNAGFLNTIVGILSNASLSISILKTPQPHGNFGATQQPKSVKPPQQPKNVNNPQQARNVNKPQQPRNVKTPQQPKNQQKQQHEAHVSSTEALQSRRQNKANKQPSGNVDNFSGQFHSTCGTNVELSNSRKTATCISRDLDQRFILSSKPVKPNEEIHLKFVRTHRDEPFGFGFTTINPDHIPDPLIFHELKEFSITWTYDVKVNRHNSEMSFFYNESGDVTYTLNDTTVTFAKRKIALVGQIWALMYIRGNNASVTMVTKKPWQQSRLPSAPDLGFVTMPTRKEKPRQQGLVLAELRYQSPEIHFEPMKFDVRKRPATNNGSFQWWFFAQNPIGVRERFVTLIQKAPKNKQCNLLLGVTCCNPKYVQWSDIPTHGQLRENTACNWLTIACLPMSSRNFADEFCYFMTADNMLRYRRNAEETQVVVVPPMGRNVWPFVKITGEESMYIKLFTGQCKEALSPCKSRVDDAEDGAFCIVSKENFEEFVTDNIVRPSTSSAAVDAFLVAELSGQSTSSAFTTVESEECTICYENKKDAVLYKCGHICMCMPCAQKQWKGVNSSGHCPLCREPILDVIKAFK